MSAAITGHEREPGFHFFLTAWPPDSLGLVTDSLWEIDQFPPPEKYAPLYARAFARLDAQVRGSAAVTRRLWSPPTT